MSTNNCFVTTIDLKLADKLREDLLSQGFTLSTPPYTLFAAKKPGVSCTLYTSGKLTVQGKNREEFLSFYLEPEILQSLAFTHPEIALDLTPHIGVDEAGKGDFFGPLCIAGVYADAEGIKKLLELGVRDSKRIGDKTILSLATKIRSFFPHSIVRLFPQKYNELYQRFGNLNRLLAWGHATVIEELVQQTSCHEVIIDQFGSESLVETALERKKITVSLTQRHQGEADLVVAAASILARAAFLEGLRDLGKTQGVELPKGAAQIVVDVGRSLVARHGSAVLQTVAKVHFKTYSQCLENS
jgi:ribonuclease HIII